MRLTAKSEYGLLAMIDIAASSNGKPLSSRTIAQGRGIPQPYLEQLMASLRRAGLVEAVRGAQGGFKLSKDSSAISVLTIVEALEGPLTSNVCTALQDEKLCSAHSNCVAAPVWAQATNALRDLFSSMTLVGLAQKQGSLNAQNVLQMEEH